MEGKDERATVKREAKPDDANAGPIWQANDETKNTCARADLATANQPTVIDELDAIPIAASAHLVY